MWTIHKQDGRRALPVVALALLVVLTGCGATVSATRATVISETSAVPSPDPTLSGAQPPTTAPALLLPPSTTPATAAATVAQAANPAGAVEAVLSYYDAINRRDYNRAYQAWLNGGAASHQSLDQFTQGFAKTVQVNVQAQTASPQANGAVTVPVTFQAVVNEPADATHDQKVQSFRGNYIVQSTGAGWKLASANVSESGGGVQLPPEFGDPLQLVRAYYDAINHREFARAYTYWSNVGQASNQSFSQFQDGFATTDRVAIELGTPQSGGAAGSTYIELPVVIVATQTDQSQHSFCGTYTLRHLNVPPFDQFGLHLEQAKIIPTASVQLNTTQSKQLLSGGCK